MYARLQSYIQSTLGSVEQINPDRCAGLLQIKDYVVASQLAREPAKLLFICTHNSRRSHMGQLWAQVAAAHFRVPGILTFSGGTETTAFDRRAVRAMSHAGFRIECADTGDNPRYSVSWTDNGTSITSFSKVYDDPDNPSGGFCAVMTCDEAAEACPIVTGASARISLPYEDPKNADGTPLEALKYDERCRQIATEMLWLFSQVSSP